MKTLGVFVGMFLLLAAMSIASDSDQISFADDDSSAIIMGAGGNCGGSYTISHGDTCDGSFAACRGWNRSAGGSCNIRYKDADCGTTCTNHEGHTAPDNCATD